MGEYEIDIDDLWCALGSHSAWLGRAVIVCRLWWCQLVLAQTMVGSTARRERSRRVSSVAAAGVVGARRM
jgi:hypothetical protein